MHIMPTRVAVSVRIDESCLFRIVLVVDTATSIDIAINIIIGVIIVIKIVIIINGKLSLVAIKYNPPMLPALVEWCSPNALPDGASSRIEP
jgi:hypothetical protein